MSVRMLNLFATLDEGNGNTEDRIVLVATLPVLWQRIPCWLTDEVYFYRGDPATNTFLVVIAVSILLFASKPITLASYITITINWLLEVGSIENLR